MSLLNHILVPINFTKCSINALDAASNFAHKNNSKVTLINVLDVANTIIKDEEVMRKENLKKLEQMAVSFNLDVDISIVKGLPAEEIIKALEGGTFSLCIMGTHERHGILSELIGTESLKVMHYTKVPLLIIPDGLKVDNINRIALATDFKQLAKLNMLNYLQELCLACDAHLHLLNINESPKPLTRQEASEALQLHQHLIGIDHTFSFSPEQDPIEGIMKYVQANKIDVLTVIPRNHSFLYRVFNDSLTEQLALHLTIPLFSLHE